MPGQRGENLRVRDVLEVGVMLAYERFTERGGYQDKRREVVVFVEREAITENERGRRDVSEESWIIVLGIAPFGDGGG